MHVVVSIFYQFHTWIFQIVGKEQWNDLALMIGIICTNENHDFYQFTCLNEELMVTELISNAVHKAGEVFFSLIHILPRL